MITLSLFSGCGSLELDSEDGGRGLRCPHFARLHHSGAMGVQGAGAVRARQCGRVLNGLHRHCSTQMQSPLPFIVSKDKLKQGAPDLQEFLVNFIFLL